MKYTKKRFSKRSPSKSWLSKKYSVGDIAQKALVGVQRLRQLVNVEHKVFDQYTLSGIPATTGLVLPLSIVLQGNTFANRQGNSIKATSFSYRFQLGSQANLNINQSIRILFIQDREFSSTATVIGDILENGPGTSLALMVAPEKHTNVKRYKILSDNTYILKPQTSTIANEEQYHKGYLSLTNHLHYSDTNPNTSSDTREGQIYMWAITELGATLPQIALYSRLMFVDN